PLLPAEQAWIATLDAPPSAPSVMDDDRVYVPIQIEQLQALSRSTGAKVWARTVQTTWPPLLVDGVLYVAANHDVQALDAATGEQRWRVPVEKGPIAPLAFAGDLLIGVFETGTVIAFAEDGRQAWTQTLGAASHFAPVSDGTRVFFVLDDNRVVAL